MEWPIDEIMHSTVPIGDGPTGRPGRINYQILGNLRVRRDGVDVTPSARKIQVLLAALLLRSGQVVTVDRLISEVWGDDPPRRCLAAVQVYVSQLRKSLGSGGNAASPILTTPSGYLLQLGPWDLDVRVFQHLVTQGRQLARERRYAEALADCDAALRLWRGPVLAGLWHSHRVDSFVTWLEEIRLECLEMQIESRLALGRHRELVSQLYSLVGEHPLREVFHRQLMLALYRSERRADALEVYRRAHRVLDTELGLEPGHALRSLHHAILQSDGSLDAVAVGSR